MKYGRIAVLVVAMVTVALVVSAGGVFAEKPPTATYLALGDSLAVGVGVTPEHQEDQFGYVGRFTRWFQSSSRGPHDIANLAVSGEKSHGFLTTQLPLALVAISAESDVQVVTLDIGGNDLRDLMAPGGPCEPPEPDPTVCLPKALQTITTLARRHAIALFFLQTALTADPGDEMVMVMGLYNPYKGTGDPFEALVDIVLAGFNGAVAQVATTFGAKFVDVYPVFDPAPALVSDDGYHPNKEGYRAMAEAFVAAAQEP